MVTFIQLHVGGARHLVQIAPDYVMTDTTICGCDYRVFMRRLRVGPIIRRARPCKACETKFRQ